MKSQRYTSSYKSLNVADIPKPMSTRMLLAHVDIASILRSTVVSQKSNREANQRTFDISDSLFLMLH